MKKQKLYVFFQIIIFSVILTSCKKNDDTIIYKSTDKTERTIYNKWLADENNFSKTEYQSKFNDYYLKGISTKNYNQSCEALCSVFSIMEIQGYYDKYYIEILDKFLKKYDQKIIPDYYCILYFYLGVNHFNNMDYLKSRTVFNKVKSIKPYNFDTYLELGNIYYFTSYSYFYTGEYVKALEENQKSLYYYSRIDSYEEHANGFKQKSDIYFMVQNTEEALKAINSSIELCKKAKDPNVYLFSFMYTKQSFLFIIYPDEAKKYIDTLTLYKENNNIKNTSDLFCYNICKFKLFLKEKNIVELEKLMPIMRSQVLELKNEYDTDFFYSLDAEYGILKNKKINNKEKILKSLDNHRRNKDNSSTKNLLNILKNEAVVNNNLKKVLEYDAEIQEINKIDEENAYRFKVQTFEKKINNAKKEKIIAQQQEQISKNKSYIVGLLMFLIILILVIVLYFAKIRKQEAKAETLRQEQFTFQLLQNTEEERSRIAGELHDGVNHDLLNIKNNLINGKTIEVNQVANVIEEVRNISRNLHPAVFETIGLEASIESLCDRISEVGLFTTCDIEYSQKLSKNKELQLYRIIQEALNNTLKHGKANAAKVILTTKNNSLHLEVKDNGTGFDVNKQLKSPKSFGLQSIMQRAKAIAAKINIDSTNKGTIILLKMPV